MISKKTKDVNIQLIRVVSMILIILSHLISEIEIIKPLAQITNSAITTFLFISAYLFSKRTITNYRNWIHIRLVKMLKPVYIFVVLLFLINLIRYNEFNLWLFLTHMLNLQGLFGGIEGATHLWFVTTIMFCYLVTPLLQKARELDDKILYAGLFLSVLIQLSFLFFVSEHIGKQLFYVIFYSVAYILSYRGFRKVETKGFVTFTLFTLLTLIVRFGFRITIGNSTMYILIVTISQAMLGLYIFLFIDKFSKLNTNNRLYRIVNFLDSINYEMYITHYSFIVGPIFIWGLTSNVILDSILVLIATGVSAVFLKKITTAKKTPLKLATRS